MKFESMNDAEKLEKIRKHVEKNDGFPTNIVWVRWLADQYSKFPLALQPLLDAEVIHERFWDLSPQYKLSKLYQQMAYVESLEHQDKTIPTPWVAWLLSEYDYFAKDAK